MFIAFAIVAATLAEPPAQPRRPVWDYKVVAYHPMERGARGQGAVESMNKLGEEGWELVSVAHEAGPSGLNGGFVVGASAFYYKRPSAGPRAKWEYKSVDLTMPADGTANDKRLEELRHSLSKLSEDGWELAVVAQSALSAQHILKRQK
jgi:hypothetical protein